MATDVAYELAPQASSPSEARSLACAWASGTGPDAMVALELVVSELVTNAIRHGSGVVTMTLARSEEGIRIGVYDQGEGMPVIRAAEARAPGGRGLKLVERLSESWGTSVTDSGGKTVWALIANGVPGVPLVSAKP